MKSKTNREKLCTVFISHNISHVFVHFFRFVILEFINNLFVVWCAIINKLTTETIKSLKRRKEKKNRQSKNTAPHVYTFQKCHILWIDRCFYFSGPNIKKKTRIQFCYFSNAWTKVQCCSTCCSVLVV